MWHNAQEVKITSTEWRAAVNVRRGHMVPVHKQHVSFSDDGRNRRHRLMLAATFIFKNQPEIWAKHKNPSTQAMWQSPHSSRASSNAHIQLRFIIQSIKHKGNNSALKSASQSVCSGRWLSYSFWSLLLGLLVAVCFLCRPPLQLLLLQSLLLLMQVRRHIVKAHLAQMLEAVVGPCGGCCARERQEEKVGDRKHSCTLLIFHEN